MNILYTSSNEFVPVMGVSITSLLENNRGSDSIRITVLGTGITQENREKLQKLVDSYHRELVLIDTEPIKKKLADWQIPLWHGSYAAWLWLFFDSAIPEKPDRILFLDGDTLINGSLDELYERDLGGAVLGMAQEPAHPIFLSKIGFPTEKRYFNSGAVLIDCALWREKDCEARMTALLRAAAGSFRFADQDAVNLLLQDEIQDIGIRYNYTSVFCAFGASLYYRAYRERKRPLHYTRQELQEAENNAVIYHFFAQCFGRPWLENCRCPCTELWEQYQAISPWKGQPKEENHLPFLMRSEAALSRILPGMLFVPVFRLTRFFGERMKV